MLNFALAEPEDDAALRTRMADDWLHGDITVSFRREPSFFHGSGVQGKRAQVIKCFDSDTNRLVGMGSRLDNEAYVNGTKQRVGYLGDLRLHPGYRGGTALARAYRYLRELHVADPLPLYTSMILEENRPALDVLTRSRCGLPAYRDVGRFVTPAIYLDVPKSPIAVDGISFRRANGQDLRQIFDFIAAHAPDKQFAPALALADMHTPRLRGLGADDFYLALRGERIIATIAAWDQTAFRQTCVERYNAGLRLMRPLYNTLSRFTALKPLPAPGSMVPYFYLALIHIEGNDPLLFRSLLRFVYNDRRKGRWSYCIAGLHETDPLSSVLREYRRIDVAGRLFVVHYPEYRSAYDQLDERIPYVEIAMI